ncbi:hypothetical protein ACTA71_010457 [Dictyostelium dimigraforme]
MSLITIIQSLAFSIGLGVLLRYTVRYILFLYAYFIRSPIKLNKYGSWVVVTGATDGIGRAYCHEFAKKNLNIILISRSLDKLKVEASEIENKYKVQTKVISFDFNTTDDSKYQDLFKQLSGIDIGVLVNNVGISYDHPMYLEELQPATIESLINLNVRAATVLSKFILTSMVEKKRGAIINLASISGITPIPLLTVYSGTKAFIEKFSLSLNLEYAPKGIFVQCVTPGIVCSKMSKIRKATLFIPTPAAFARSAVATIGYDRLTTGYWSHEIQGFFLRNLPSFIVDKLMLDMHLAQRKRALNKKKSQ